MPRILKKDELQAFIVKAKANSYVGQGQKSLAYRPFSHDLQFHEDPFAYLDSYFGGTDFLGQEVVYFEGKPVWAMNYYGRILNPDLIDAQKAGKIIMESLGKLYQAGRFLGGYENETPLGKYIDTNEGDVFSFKGLEWITVQNEKVYELVYHGGLVKD
jgi:hypothetical protein